MSTSSWRFAVVQRPAARVQHRTVLQRWLGATPDVEPPAQVLGRKPQHLQPVAAPMQPQVAGGGPEGDHADHLDTPREPGDQIGGDDAAEAVRDQHEGTGVG